MIPSYSITILSLSSSSVKTCFRSFAFYTCITISKGLINYSIKQSLTGFEPYSLLWGANSYTIWIRAHWFGGYLKKKMTNFEEYMEN